MDFWHLAGRGVEKRDIVLDDSDRLRFIHDLFVLDDLNPVENYELPSRREERPKRKLLVHIHAFCLMPNHYHLLVSEAAENGISLFMHKLNMGYAKYFNERYERSGSLWQGKYRKVPVTHHAHFLYIPYYIHLNPLDYVMPEWRQGGVQNVSAALDHLTAYRWSSHLDYLGMRNFPSITRRDELSELLGNQATYEQTIADIISNPELAQGGNELEWAK
ncbi:MAG TPA: transposase [Candidatus Paceibacterota bacterium]